MPYHLLKVNSLRENWPLERDFGDFGLKAGQQLHFEKSAEAGNSDGNRLAERQLPIEWWRCCQTNANSSQYGNNMLVLCSTELLPLDKSSFALNLKYVSGI
jgi:hypothetical protein